MRNNSYVSGWPAVILVLALVATTCVGGCALRDLATPPRPLYPPCADSAATRDSTTGRCADTTEVGR